MAEALFLYFFVDIASPLSNGELGLKTIYLGNLPTTASEDDVKTLFGRHGEVAKVSLITDRETGQPRGFGFVEMESEAADKAIEALDGCDFGGRTLRVNEARDRGARPPRRSW